MAALVAMQVKDEATGFQLGPDFQHLDDWFGELNSSRSMGFSGPNPLSFSDIAAWMKLSGHVVRREEIAILRQMDAAFLRAVAERQDQSGSGTARSPEAGDEPMSAALFDAMFAD